MRQIILILLALLLSNCSYNVSRVGYEKSDSAKICKVYIFKDIDDTSKIKKIGSVSLSNNWFIFSCNANDAISLLKKEACSINANIINITNEHFPDNSSDCYKCDAEFFIDSNKSVIDHKSTYYPEIRKPFAPFANLPFNYLYLHTGIEYNDWNKDYWKGLFNNYNLPFSEPPTIMLSGGLTLIVRNYYFEFNSAYDEHEDYNSDSLKSTLMSMKFGLDFGYNLLNKTVTISPYIGLRYNYQRHTISLKKDNIAIDQWRLNPDISLRAKQFSGVIGLNVTLPLFVICLMSCDFGYNFNFHKYPYLSSNISNIDYSGIPLLKEFYINLEFGLGGPIDDSFKK